VRGYSERVCERIYHKVLKRSISTRVYQRGYITRFSKEVYQRGYINEDISTRVYQRGYITRFSKEVYQRSRIIRVSRGYINYRKGISQGSHKGHIIKLISTRLYHKVLKRSISTRILREGISSGYIVRVYRKGIAKAISKHHPTVSIPLISQLPYSITITILTHISVTSLIHPLKEAIPEE